MAPKKTSFKLRMPSKQTRRIIGEVGALCLESITTVLEVNEQQRAAAAAAAARDRRDKDGGRRASDRRDRSPDAGYSNRASRSREYSRTASYREGPPKPRKKSDAQAGYASEQYSVAEQHLDYGGHYDSGSRNRSRQRRPDHDDYPAVMRRRDGSRGRY